jgi:hypothetical protein
MNYNLFGRIGQWKINYYYAHFVEALRPQKGKPHITKNMKHGGLTVQEF